MPGAWHRPRDAVTVEYGHVDDGPESGPQPDVTSLSTLRENVEAGLRLLLKSEKPLYRRTAEVALEDLTYLYNMWAAEFDRLRGIEEKCAELEQDRAAWETVARKHEETLGLERPS
jgi:hypothetical protein